MAVNRTLLQKKSLISLRELEELIFPPSKRESDQVKQARRDFEALVIDALEAGRLGYLDWYFNDSPFNSGHYAKFEKRVVCAWIIQVDALEGIEVADEVVEFIEQAAKEKKRVAKSPDKEKTVKKKHSSIKPTGKKKNTGGHPGADPYGEIKAKIEELQLDGVKDDDIPWDIRFTRFVQKLKSDKISVEYRSIKVPSRVKGKEYTAYVGISPATIERIMREIDKESTK